MATKSPERSLHTSYNRQTTIQPVEGQNTTVPGGQSKIEAQQRLDKLMSQQKHTPPPLPMEKMRQEIRVDLTEKLLALKKKVKQLEAGIVHIEQSRLVTQGPYFEKKIKELAKEKKEELQQLKKQYQEIYQVYFANMGNRADIGPTLSDDDTEEDDGIYLAPDLPTTGSQENYLFNEDPERIHLVPKLPKKEKEVIELSEDDLEELEPDDGITLAGELPNQKDKPVEKSNDMPDDGLYLIPEIPKKPSQENVSNKRMETVVFYQKQFNKLQEEVRTKKADKGSIRLETEALLNELKLVLDGWKKAKAKGELTEEEAPAQTAMIELLRETKEFNGALTSVWKKVGKWLAGFALFGTLTAGTSRAVESYQESQETKAQLSEIQKNSENFQSQSIPKEVLTIHSDANTPSTNDLFKNFENTLIQQAKEEQKEELHKYNPQVESLEDMMSSHSFALDEKDRGLMGVYTKYHEDYNIDEVYGVRLAKRIGIETSDLGKFKQVCDAMYFRHPNLSGSGVTKVDFGTITNQAQLRYDGHQQAYNDQFARTVDFAKRLINSEKNKLTPEALQMAESYVKADWQVWAYTQKLTDTLKKDQYKNSVIDDRLGIGENREEKSLFSTIENLFAEREQTILNLYQAVESDPEIAKDKAELAIAYEFLNWWPQIREQIMDSVYSAQLIPVINDLDEDYQYYQALMEKINGKKMVVSPRVASK